MIFISYFLSQGIIYLTGFGFSNRGKRHTLNNPEENPYLKKEVGWLFQTSRSKNTGSRLIVDIMIMFFQGSLDIIDSGMQKKIPIFENKNMQVPIDSSLQRFIHTTLKLHLISYLVQYSFTQLSPEPDLPRWVLLQQHRRHFGLEKVPDVPGLEKKQLHFIFVRTNNTKYLPKSLLHDIDFFYFSQDLNYLKSFSFINMGSRHKRFLPSEKFHQVQISG